MNKKELMLPEEKYIKAKDQKLLGLNLMERN